MMYKLVALLVTLFGLIHTYCNAQIQNNTLTIVKHESSRHLLSSENVLDTFQPLDKLTVSGKTGTNFYVTDGAGNRYFNGILKPTASFTIGGAIGNHTIYATEPNSSKTLKLSFALKAETSLEDHGYYESMFNLFYNSMWDLPNQIGHTVWNGKRYHHFVPWGLDHNHTMKGLKYFNGLGSEFVDLCREAQREDGMIWSFVEHHSNVDYYFTRDKFTGYTKKIGDKAFVRQPTENHNEYIFVNSIYQCWKASGNHQWMKKNLPAAVKALNYSITDPARWSKRFKLLKRVYTIDSWDFQVEDEYLPNLGITNSMILDPLKSKFGIFFGDNTGYIKACQELAEMFEEAGNKRESEKYTARSVEFKNRLDSLSWNGKFYTHYIDEDSAVVRNLGVIERSQLAQSNAYTLNRELSPIQKEGIIQSYINLYKNLPTNSPGEWYSIYPPFERGFTIHNAAWQYMNGGVGGHVAGELALGAFQSGFEEYGVDILSRLFELGKKHNNKIYFAYTGSIPSPPPDPVFRTINLQPYANMDYSSPSTKNAIPWMMAQRKGDDLRAIPKGKRKFEKIEFDVIDADKNNQKSVVAISRRPGLPSSSEIKINDTASAIYLLHTSSKPGSENIVGNMIINYEDGDKKNSYLVFGKHLTYWWFPELKTERSGVAWYGKNEVSEGVGLSWCALDNPFPAKKIKSITFQSPADNGIYTLLAISLADRPHYTPVNPVSFGGPDNWAGAISMYSLIEGLVGITNSEKSEALSIPRIAPRWLYTRTDTIKSTVRFKASNGYASYIYQHDQKKREIQINLTGSGNQFNMHIPIPATSAINVFVDDKPVNYEKVMVRNTSYVDFRLEHRGPRIIHIRY